jgi:hypothetical protein
MEHSYWLRVIKLDPSPLDEDPRPIEIEAKLRWNLHGTNLQGNSIGPNPKMKLKGKLMIWRIEM